MIPTLSGTDIRIEDLNDACQKLTHKTPPWGIRWNSIRWMYCLTYLAERNRRLKQHTLRSPEILSMAITRDIGFSFKPAYIENWRYCSQLEVDTMQVWEINLMRLTYRKMSMSKDHFPLFLYPLFVIQDTVHHSYNKNHDFHTKKTWPLDNYY